MKTFFIFLALLFALPVSLWANDWDDFVQSLSYDEETMDEEKWQEYLDGLEQLHIHPLDINTASPEDMAQIPFLSPGQIEDIQAYVHLDGPMKSLGELALIPSIDIETRKILPLFFTISPATKTSALNHKYSWFDNMKHTADTRIDIPFYYRLGQSDGKYAGDPLYNRIRYNMESRNVLAGAHVEKDAGERFYDSGGAFIMLRDKRIVRQAIVGDYRTGWGEGLVICSRSSASKTTMMLGSSQGIRPMTGTSETGYLRGAAITLGSNDSREFQNVSSGFKKLQWQTTLFASVNAIDATLTDEGYVQTILTTGLHRTALERSKKNNTLATILGTHAQLKIRHFTVGFSGYWQHFGRHLEPGSQIYRRFYPQGTDFGVMGLHAGYSHYRWTVSTEVAYNTNHNGIATIGRVQWLALRQLKVGLLGRYYSHKYYSFLSAAVGENSKNQNETGAMLRLETQPLRHWTLTTFADFFSDYWPRYQMSHSSYGQEFMIENIFTIGSNGSINTLSLRYQLKRKESADKMIPHHRLRLQWTFVPREGWKLQTTGSMHLADEKALGNSTAIGYSVSSMLKSTWLKDKSLRSGLMLGYFNTPDYLSRVYVYEPALWSSVAGQTYSGKGLRFATTLCYTFPRSHWMIEAKYMLTKMFDRNTISSDEQTIYSSLKNDLSIQLRMTY